MLDWRSVWLVAGQVSVACVVGQLAISANASGAPDLAACPAPATVCVALSGSCHCNRDTSCNGRALYSPDEHAAGWVIVFSWRRPTGSPVPVPASLGNAAELVVAFSCHVAGMVWSPEIRFSLLT